MLKRDWYYRDTALYFSALYGRAVYETTGECIADPFVTHSDESGYSPVLINITTGQRVFLRLLHLTDEESMLLIYRERILHPPSREIILWPVDLIVLNEEQKQACTLFVDRIYSPENPPPEQRPANYAAAFVVQHYPPMRDGTATLPLLGPLNWKTPSVQRAACQITLAIDALNQEGYVYNEFHLSRFCFTEEGQLYLDYSNLACARRELSEKQYSAFRTPRDHNYPPEFACPAMMQARMRMVNFQTQNYSLCALLFYLLFGRYAYDGKLLSGYPDESTQNHYVKFRDYHKMPVFIFDERDRRNTLGIFTEHKALLSLWSECPLELRLLFTSALAQDNAVRALGAYSPIAADWIQCFRELGWLDDKTEENRETNQNRDKETAQ